MDYERIQKPQGGGFSPRKLREILLGIEKKRMAEDEEEEIGAGFDLRSDDGGVEFRGLDALESCKDVDIEAGSLESSGSASSSVFEFHKTVERIPHRSPAYIPPFSKPAPSKWDDAEKWIASPTSNRTTKSNVGVIQQKKSTLGGYGNKSFGTKVVLEVTDEIDKRIDPSLAKKDIDVHALMDDKNSSLFENPFADSAINANRHDSSTAVQSVGEPFPPPPSTVKSISMRDMGTEMTPIASQDPSRTETPNRSTTPARSATSSRALSPTRIEPNSAVNESDKYLENYEKNELSETELKLKTKREIMVLGQQLGKPSIAAWASKQVEVNDATESKVSHINVNEARAAAWEDAERAKYLARFKQEEIKIQAWENHQKAKTEAEMKKIEVEIENMRARAHEKLMTQLAAARHKAEEKRAAAEAKRNKQSTKTMQQVDHIKKTGRIPSSSSCFGFCS